MTMAGETWKCRTSTYRTTGNRPIASSKYRRAISKLPWKPRYSRWPSRALGSPSTRSCASATYVRGDWQTLALRLFLALVGIGVGVMAVYGIAEPAPVLPFLIGFGLVHLPPALVLMLKRMRGESPS